MIALTDNDYEELRPYFPVIRKYREIGTWVSTEEHQVMARVEQRISGDISNLRCSDCIARLYNIMNEYLDQYENAKR